MLVKLGPAHFRDNAEKTAGFRAAKAGQENALRVLQ